MIVSRSEWLFLSANKSRALQAINATITKKCPMNEKYEENCKIVSMDEKRITV